MNLVKQLTEIGKLVATHGVKGEFKLWINENIEVIKPLVNQQMFLQDLKNNLDVFEVIRLYNIKNKVIVQLANINSINEAQKFVNQKVFVKTDLELVKQIQSLIGFQVISQDTKIGEVIDLMNNGAHELLKVQEGNLSYWVPNVERYIKKIDWENNCLVAVDLEMLK